MMSEGGLNNLGQHIPICALSFNDKKEFAFLTFVMETFYFSFKSQPHWNIQIRSWLYK